MPWGFAAAAVATIGAGVMSADASKDAARTQQQGARDASAVQQNMYNQSAARLAPFEQSGYGANSELSRLVGITPQTASGAAPGTPTVAQQWDQSNGRLVGDTYLPPDVQTNAAGNGWYGVNDNAGNYLGRLRPGGNNGVFEGVNPIPTPLDVYNQTHPQSAGGQGASAAGPQTGPTGLPTGYLTQTFGPEQFKQGIDPGYQWRLQQGNQSTMNTAGAGSGALSGPALKALLDYNQGAGSQEYGAAFDRFQTQQGNIYQRLAGIANLGQNAAAGVGAQGVQTGANIGANIVGGANAGAAGQIGAANAYSGAASDLGSLGYLYALNQKKVS